MVTYVEVSHILVQYLGPFRSTTSDNMGKLTLRCWENIFLISLHYLLPTFILFSIPFDVLPSRWNLSYNPKKITLERIVLCPPCTGSSCRYYNHLSFQRLFVLKPLHPYEWPFSATIVLQKLTWVSFHVIELMPSPTGLMWWISVPLFCSCSDCIRWLSQIFTVSLPFWTHCGNTSLENLWQTWASVVLWHETASHRRN